MKRAISSISVSILLISSIFIGMVNFAPVAKAETGGPYDMWNGIPGDGIWGTDADWRIEPGDDITHTSITIVVNGNLVVNGSLTLRDVNLQMSNATSNGMYNITVLENGNLTIQDLDDNPLTTADASIVNSSSFFRFGFAVYSGSSFEMKNSELQNCGWGTTNFIDRFGLFINSDWVNFTGNQITNSYMGVIVWESNNVNVSGNTFDTIDHTGINISANYTYVSGNQVSYAYIGIAVETHNNNTITDNKITNIEFRGINILNSEYIAVDYNNVSNVGDFLSSDTWPVGIYLGGCYNISVMHNNLTGVGDSNSGRGILAYFNSVINISYNNIVNNPNTYGITIARGFFYYIYNNTLNNNFIGVFITADGSSYTTSLCDVIDNEILNNDYGVYLQGINDVSAVQDIFIYSNQIYSNNNAGIFLYGYLGPYAINYVFIRGNEIYNNGASSGDAIVFYGDLIMDDIGFIYCWENSIRQNFGSGYFLYRVDSIFIWDDYLYKNDENIWARSASNVIVENTTFVRGDGGSDIDIRADDLNGAGGKPSSVWFINTTYNKNYARVYDSGSFLNVSRYLHVRVVQGGAGVDNADVWVDDVFGNPGVHDPTSSEPFNTGTGNDGWIRWLNVTELNRTGVTGSSWTTTIYTDHTVNASFGPGFGTNVTTMTQSREIWVILNTPPSAIDLNASAGNVYRGNTIYITANGTDPEDSEDALTPHFEYRPPGGMWDTTYLGSPTYIGSAPTGHWQVPFSPPGNAPVGLYDFRVYFNDTYGTFSTTLVNVSLVDVLNNPPVANAGADFTVAAGHLFDFDASNSTDDNGTVSLSYAWDVDDSNGVSWSPANLNGINPTYNYSMPGDYTATLKVTDSDGGEDITTVLVTVVDIDPPDVNAGPDGFVKINTPYNFSAAASTDNVGIVWYNWSFGDGAYDNGTNVTPQHIYTSINTFTVTLTCTDAAGNWGTAIIDITVILSDAPVANAGSDNSTDEDSAITLDGSASTDDLGITGYFWDIDASDGIDWASPDLTGMVVDYTYLTPGVYTVTLNVTDGDGGWDIDTVIITVNDITNPVANAGPDDSWDEDSSYIFDGTGSSDNSGTITSYDWDFGEGNATSGADPQPSHTFPQPGIYIVTLTVWDATGNWATDTMTITILDITAPNANAGPGATVDEDAPVPFDGSGSYDNVGIVTFYWDMDDSDGLDWVSPDQMGVTPVHVYSMPGTYTVTLNCTDAAGNSGYDTVTIFVNDITNPAANAGPDDSVNEDAVYNFDGSGSSDNVGIASYKWDIDSTDGVDWMSPDYTVVDPSHIYTQPGPYVATLRVEDAAGNWATDTVAITVNDITNPIANAGADDTVNHGTPKTFDGTGSTDNVAIDTYEWDMDAGDGVNWLMPDYTGSTPTHNYAQPGIYTATLRVTDTTGNSATDTVQITVVDITDPIANAGPNDSVNEDTSYQFDGSGSSDDVAIVDYAWDIDDTDGVDWVTPDYVVVDPSHIYIQPGQYTATLRVEDGDGNWDTDTVTIDVLDITDPIANAGLDTTIDEDSPYQFDGSLSTDNSGAIASYNWDFNDGTYSNGTDSQPYHTFSQPGVYIVTLTVIDAAGNSNSDTVQITVLDITDPFADAGPDDTWDEDTEYVFDGSASFDNVGITGYAWDIDFTDGLNWITPDFTGPNLMNPGYTYPEPGTYTVTLNVTDASGNWAVDTMVITIEDVTYPTADAGPDDSVNEDAPYTFNASGSTDNVGITTYAWDMDDSDGLDWITPDHMGVTPTHIYTEPGVYIVTVNITDFNGNWVTDTVAITVVDITPPTADAGPDDSLDEDLPYTFDASGSSDNHGIAVYMWDVDDSDGLDWVNPDLTNASATYTFTEPGIYTVTLRVTDAAGNWALDTVVIEVYDITSPAIFVEYTDPMNEDIAYLFNASATYDNSGIASFNFSFGDGFYKFGSSPTAIHTYEEPGIYIATVTVIDFTGNPASVIFDVTVLDTTAPSTPAGFTVGQVEAGEALNLSWLAVADSDLHHYELYFSEDGVNFEVLGNLTANTLLFTHEDLTNGETYYYYLMAVDTHGLSSKPSDIVSAAPDRNSDGDAEFDLTDEDDDNDGVNDDDDLFPNNPDEWADFDGDGIGDNTDDDDDGDGIVDANDDLPLNPLETIDSDGDGLGDNEDPDDDNDGIFDDEDAFPYDPEKYKEPTDLFTYLLYLIIIIALIIAAVLGARGGKHKRQSRELSRKIAQMEKDQAQVPPPSTTAPAPPPWMQAKTAPPVPPPAAKPPSAPPPKPPVKEEPKPSEPEPEKVKEPVTGQKEGSETAELLSEGPKDEPTTEKPPEPEEEVVTFEAVDEKKPVPAPPPAKSAGTAKTEGEAGKPRPPRPPKKKKA